MRTDPGSKREHKASVVNISFGRRANLPPCKCRRVEQGKNLARFGLKDLLHMAKQTL
jgi:hypothetical protein